MTTAATSYSVCEGFVHTSIYAGTQVRVLTAPLLNPTWKDQRMCHNDKLACLRSFLRVTHDDKRLNNALVRASQRKVGSCLHTLLAHTAFLWTGLR